LSKSVETDSNTESDKEQETSQSQTQEKRSQYLNTKLQPQRKCYKTTVAKLYNLYRSFFFIVLGPNFLKDTKNYPVTKITGQALKT
jgi:stalled ribosome rescue protein Dom34